MAEKWRMLAVKHFENAIFPILAIFAPEPRGMHFSALKIPSPKISAYTEIFDSQKFQNN